MYAKESKLKKNLRSLHANIHTIAFYATPPPGISPDTSSNITLPPRPTHPRQTGNRRRQNNSSQYPGARAVSSRHRRRRGKDIRIRARIRVTRACTARQVGIRPLVLLEHEERRQRGEGAHLLAGGAVQRVAVVVALVPAEAAGAVREAAGDGALGRAAQHLHDVGARKGGDHGHRRQGAVHVALERVLVDVALHRLLELAGPLDHDALGEEVVDSAVEETGNAGAPFLFSVGLDRLAGDS